MYEETSIKIENPILVFEFKDYHKDNFDFYYLCDYVSGEPELGGEEKMKNNPDNSFDPQWIEITKVKELVLFPGFAKDWIVETLIEKSK